MQIKRSKWTENISGAKAEHQIYLDESGINTNLTRHYAHAVYGKRAVDATPINTPHRPEPPFYHPFGLIEVWYILHIKNEVHSQEEENSYCC